MVKVAMRCGAMVGVYPRSSFVPSNLFVSAGKELAGRGVQQL